MFSTFSNPLIRSSSAQRALVSFERRFDCPPALIVRAPGRVNLIGEHTDYNEGFVLPAAIDLWTVIALQPRNDSKIVLHSLDLDCEAELSLDRPVADGQAGWIRYAAGVAALLADTGVELRGWEGVVASDVPIGAGLSSSAAFELAVARAFVALGSTTWDPRTMARLCQRAENQWAGVDCGIMDQLASACGRQDHALLIDCRSLAISPAPLGESLRLVVLDTDKRRNLTGSPYNERRAQCAEAARACGVKSLRDLTPMMLEYSREQMDETVYRRARHVLSENARTLAVFEALNHGDVTAIGPLMSTSHASLRDDFEVSCLELDTMVEIAAAQHGCIGARMTGAGFGGCAVALVRAETVETFIADVRSFYHNATGLVPTAYACRPVNGAETVGL